MMDIAEAADWVRRMRFYDSLDEYNEETGDSLTWEDAMNGSDPHVYLLDDGSVVVA